MQNDNGRTVLCVCYCRSHLAVCINEAVGIENVRIGSLQDNERREMPSENTEHMTHIDCPFTVDTPKTSTQVS